MNQQQGSAKPKGQICWIKFWTGASSHAEELQSLENIYEAHVDRPITMKEVLLWKKKKKKSEEREPKQL